MCEDSWMNSHAVYEHVQQTSRYVLVNNSWFLRRWAFAETVMSPWELPVGTRTPLPLCSCSQGPWAGEPPTAAMTLPWAPGSSAERNPLSPGGGHNCYITYNCKSWEHQALSAFSLSSDYFNHLLFPFSNSVFSWYRTHRRWSRPIPQAQDHREKTGHGLVMRSYFRPQYPLQGVWSYWFSLRKRLK